MNKNHLNSLKRERDIFGLLKGEFVVQAVFTFTHQSYVCFVMEYMYGGDIGSLLQQYGYFDENTARFFISEIILAVDYLH